MGQTDGSRITPPRSGGSGFARSFRNSHRSWVLAPAVVFLVGAAARLGVVFAGAGPGGNYGYDVGVYFAASDALVHGRLPYRDFVLLHPPGLMLSLTPFAVLGRLTTDHIGFMAANLAFSVLGAVNAALVVLIARRFGLGLRAAVAGGLFYALWIGSVQAEYLARLEPLGNFFLLLGIYAFATTRAASSRGWYLGGLAFGLAASVKVWWVVPLVLALAWVAITTRNRRQTLRVALGAATSMILVNGVFFALAPGQMWRMVVTEQLGRPTAVSLSTRLGDMLTVTSFHAHPGAFVELVAKLALVVVIVGGVALGLTVPRLRAVGLLFIVQLAVLLGAPSWFNFYSDFLSPAAALCVAIGTWRLFPPVGTVAAVGSDRGVDRTIPRVVASALVVSAVAAAMITSSALADGYIVSPLPAKQLRAAVASSRCVMSDSPMALIALNVLSRDLRNGCQNWVDVTGRTYGADKSDTTRPRNIRWQRDLYSYLSSGQTLITIRPATGIAPATLTRLHRNGVVARVGRFIVYRSPRVVP